MSFGQKVAGFRRFMRYYAPYKGLLIADVLCALAVGAIALAIPILIRFITTEVLTGGVETVRPQVLAAGGAMVGLIVVKTLTAVFYDYKGHQMGAMMERDMRAELFAHLQKLPFSFYDNNETGKLMSRITGDLLDIAEVCHHLPENVAVYGTQFMGALVILLGINYKLTLLVCAFLPIIAIYSFVFYHKLGRAYKENRQRIAEINACVEENLSGIRVVQGLACENAEIEKFGRENHKFFMGRASIYKHEALFHTVVEMLLTQLITVAIVVVGGLWIAGGTLDLPNLLVFILYSGYLTGPVPKLAFMIQQYQSGVTGYRRFREIVDTVPDIRDAPDAAELTVRRGEVELRGVAFRYSDEHENVLRDVSLRVLPGETVAIVGPSGIGKTTLCSLIPRYYDVTEGEILVDGVDVRSVTLASLRRQIGVVRQETFLFSGTVLENILYSRPNASFDEVVEAARKAGAHDFICALPGGYHTEVGQRGVKLSGGQRQRISIARVFLLNPPILIFDEATSALDNETEQAVIRSLRLLSADRTTFIIAHRLSTIQHAGRVFELTNEGVVERSIKE